MKLFKTTGLLLSFSSIITQSLAQNVSPQLSKRCDVQGPIDILADKVCSWKGENPGKQVCSNCVKKIFKNEGQCDWQTVEFPPQLSLCQAAVKDKAFVDKLNELCVDKYIDKIEAMLEQIPKLKSSFCSENSALNDFMKDDEDEKDPGILEQIANSDFGKDCAEAVGTANKVVGEVMGALGDIGGNVAKRNGGFCIKRFKALIDKICGKEESCTEIKSCFEQQVNYVIDYVT